MTLYRLEAGQSAISFGTLVRVMSVLGLETDFELLARDDRLVGFSRTRPCRRIVASAERLRTSARWSRHER
jgi:hypothetical protein